MLDEYTDWELLKLVTADTTDPKLLQTILSTSTNPILHMAIVENPDIAPDTLRDFIKENLHLMNTTDRPFTMYAVVRAICNPSCPSDLLIELAKSNTDAAPSATVIAESVLVNPRVPVEAVMDLMQSRDFDIAARARDVMDSMSEYT